MDVERRNTMPDGKTMDDRTQIVAWMAPGEMSPQIQLINGDNGWARAEVHTGDQVLKFNSSPINSVAELMGLLEPLHAGDIFRIEMMHEGECGTRLLRSGPASLWS